ncbi:AsmA family protein [Roseomonas sp. AR75]|uniref:AsmA family protein n=1 Tax=Roseomonas sp. AR75 TaxID=2562311 RepID=UPI0014858547|nr:AsmA family protein [Roseomonas sp. AR75]
MGEGGTPAARRRRWPWILLAVLVVLPLAGFVALRVFASPESLRPRLVAAVEQATGRNFSVGDVELGLSLRPTVILRDVALANVEGGSRPQMLTADRVEVQAALLPLLSRRVEIARIELDRPDLLLETNGEGRGNWQFRPAAPPAATPSTSGAPAAPSQPLAISLDRLDIEEGRVTWRDARSGLTETIAIARLQAAAPNSGATTARGTLRLRDQPVELVAETAPLSAFGGAAPIPVQATLASQGAEARLRGTIAPDGAWEGEVAATIPDMARLAPLLPGTTLPPLRELAASATLAGSGGEIGSARDIVLRLGAADLGAWRPGLALTRLEATAPRLDAPLQLAAEARQGNIPVSLAGTAGTPALLLGRAAGPLPVDLGLQAAGATATVKGQVRDPLALAGVELALAARVPDLAALSPLAGTTLPAIRDLSAEARLAERGPGFRNGAVLRGIALTAPPIQASGELTLATGARPAVNGRLDVARLDLDALRSAAPAAPQPTPAQPAPGASQPAPPPAPASGDGRVIPDIALPVAALRGFDADLQLRVVSMTAGGATWRDLRLPVKLEAGRGRVAPFAVTGPGGQVTGELSADAAANPPTLGLTLRAPGLDLAPLQQALGQPVRVAGRAEIDAQLRGSGAGLRAVAATLDGHLGLAMVDATLEPALMNPVQQALRSRVPVPLDLPNRLPVECVALRAQARDGTLAIGTLLVDAPAAKVAGSGTVSLGTEQIALRLLHDVRAAGQTVRVTADLGGTLAAPEYRGVRAENLAQVLGGLAGRVGGDAGALLGALAGRSNTRSEPLPECAPALAAARGGREGSVPAARPAEAAAPQPAQPAPQQPAERAIPGVPPQLQGPASDLLRGLLRR